MACLRATGSIAVLASFASLIQFQTANAQTTILATQAGGGTLPTDWVGQNNVATNLIDRTTYWLVDAGNPGDFLISSNYNLSTYASVTVNVNVATFGSGGNNALKIEYSTDGGSSWNPTSFTTATPTSSTYVTGGPVTIAAAFSATTKLRFSASGTSGKGVRIQQLGITGIISGGDTNPPAISSRIPAIGATGVAVNPALSITFDEPIVLSTGTVHLFKEAGGSDVEIPIGTVGVSGAIASFAPTVALENSTTYYVLVDATAFTDNASPTHNAFPGISSETAWTFVTVPADTTPPIATLSPADDATAVPSASNLVISYNESITVGTGTINLYKTGGTLVQAFAVPTNVTVSGNTLTINPSLLLEPNTGYYLEVPAGVVVDTSSNANPSAAIAPPSGWNFTTRPVPSVVINQYYEGTGALDRYIELKNTTNLPVSLDGYRLTVWSNTAPSDNEGWKSGTATTDREVIFGALTTIPTIEANSTLLIANIGAAVPAYAASSANLKAADVDEATFFNGDDSVVLYFGATNDRANVMDVVSIVATEATDTSFYRLTDTPAFNFDIGSSITQDLGQAWQQIACPTVDAATSANPYYLQAYQAPIVPVLNSFVIGNGATTAVTSRVTLDYTTTDGSPTEYIVSESSDFSGATWTAMPGTSPVVDLSAGNGTKTLYFKVRNSFGESVATLNDTITRASFTSAGSVIFTQYYEGTSNNKYVEITNTSASSVDLSTWKLVRWGNAEAENWKITNIALGSGSSLIPLTGTLSAGQTVVLSNSSAASPVTSGSAFLSSSNINHTGNDSYALYEGAVSAENLRDALSFTTANEGVDKSFVRISPGMGFDFDSSTSITTIPTVWEQVTLAVVNAATPDDKEYLGTYLDVVPVGYASWIDSYFTGVTNPLIIGFNADPDLDGIPNGVEALIGGNPSTAGVFATTELVKAGNVFSFLYPQDNALPSGVTAGYEWSTDMIHWQAGGASYGGVTVTIADFIYSDTEPDVDIYQVDATVTAGTPAQLFVRVVAHN